MFTKGTIVSKDNNDECPLEHQHVDFKIDDTLLKKGNYDTYRWMGHE